MTINIQDITLQKINELIDRGERFSVIAQSTLLSGYDPDSEPDPVWDDKDRGNGAIRYAYHPRERDTQG